MGSLDKTYYLKRMETELRLADKASNPMAQAAHRQLAGHYKKRLDDSRLESPQNDLSSAV